MESENNRIENEISLWLSKEEKVKNLFKRSPAIERSCAREKLKFYERLLTKYKKTKVLEEIMALQFVKNESKSLIQILYPNKFERFIYKAFSSIVGQRMFKHEYLKEQERNRDSLEHQLKNCGFPDSYCKVLENMKQEQSKFSVPVSYYISEKEKLEHSLYFLKDDQGAYQFDGFRSTLHNYSTPYFRSTHYFKNERSENYNVQEAYNLLAGRAVLKNGSWKQFNLNDQDLNDNYRIKEFPQAYGYDLEKAVSDLPLKISGQTDLDSLISSLKEGRREEAVLLINGKEKQIYIEANPHFRNLTIFNGNMQKINLGNQRKDGMVQYEKKQGMGLESSLPKKINYKGKSKSL